MDNEARLERGRLIRSRHHARLLRRRAARSMGSESAAVEDHQSTLMLSEDEEQTVRQLIGHARPLMD